MSAIRTHRSHRSTQLPYARPPAKKSTWSLIGLLNYFNPLRSRSPVDSIDLSVDSHGDEQTPNRQVPPIAQSLSARGHQMAQDIDSHGRTNASAGPSSQVHQSSVAPPLDTFEPPSTPTRSAVPHSLQDSHSPANNIERVSNFLSERAGKSISNSEVEGIVALLRQNTPPADKPEAFRFTSRLSTPVRESSPFLPNTNDTSYSFNTRAPQTFTPSPRKTLSKNPNGVYRWEGLGSAKAQRSRNRYSSPAFGPSRPSSDRLVLKESQTVSEAPKTDAKRRKVGGGAQNSSSVPSGTSNSGTNGSTSNLPLRSSSPGPSPNRTSEAFPFPVSSGSPVPPRPLVATPTPAPQLNGLSTTTRLRTPAKPTAPVVPSPLRQAWSGSSSSSKIGSPPPQTIQKQTKAANFMTELIKEVTPPKRPDLSNPYQTASPVGKVVLPKPRVGKRIRATGKPAVPPATDDKSKEQNKPTEKEKEYSHQAIIEATLPKGSKRSRPPAHFEKSPPSVSDFFRPPSAPDTPSSLLDDERHPVSNEQFKTTSYLVEEMDNDEHSEPATKKLKSYPIRESKSTTPTPDIVIEEMDGMDAQNPVQKSQIPASAPTSIFGASGSGATSPTKASGRPLFPAFKPTLPKEPSKLRFSYQPEPGSSLAAPAPGPVASGSDAPPPPAGSAVQSVTERDEDIQVLKTSKEAALAIPRDALPTFVFSITTVLTSASIPSHLKALEEAKTVPKASLPSFDFSLAILNSNAEVPKLVPPPVKAFDWGAAGMKKPINPADGSGPWACSTCMLSNPVTAIDKCGICQAPR